MTPEELNNIATELKRLGGELKLSDQKEDLKSFLTEKFEQLQEYKRQNPNISKEDAANYIAKNRAAGREKLEKFLTPEQLKIWDAATTMERMNCTTASGNDGLAFAWRDYRTATSQIPLSTTMLAQSAANR